MNSLNLGDTLMVALETCFLAAILLVVYSIRVTNWKWTISQDCEVNHVRDKTGYDTTFKQSGRLL